MQRELGLSFIFIVVQFLNKAEYLKGFQIFESIIGAYASYVDVIGYSMNDASRAEL
uniref:Uncharacterized protein n=1 Tax=Nelumbo nucifera TaxID=4432 RepID=A0A822Z8X4_NELNU|nr:TPA_asm: hypothetical protein HUJ06_014474 [Nelumbo nucifera]